MWKLRQWMMSEAALPFRESAQTRTGCIWTPLFVRRCSCFRELYGAVAAEIQLVYRQSV